MRVLALDPGTTCGWCLYDSDTGELTSGSWDISVGRDESADMRLLRLQAALNSVGHVDLLVFEAAKEGKFAKAVRIQGQLEATVMLWARQRLPPVPYFGVNPATVLRWLMGKHYVRQLRAIQAEAKANGGKKPSMKALKMRYAYHHLEYRGDVTDHDQMDAFVLCQFFIATELQNIQTEEPA
jgi:hypothetical protein